MQNCLDFLKTSVDFMYTVMNFQIIPGITIWTVFFYNLLLIVIYTAFTRR